MKSKIFLRCIIGIFLSFVLITGIAEYMHKDISDGIVRLHIIANSDDDIDQNVKLMVRDAVIKEQKEIFPDGIKKELNKEEKKRLTVIAEEVLKKQGIDYGALVESGNFYFPTKEYENITLPAGNYDAVRIVLGKGLGKNWWCVMYPPLCFTDSALGSIDKESERILKESMGDFEYGIISKEDIKTVPAFKLVEIWQKVKEKIKNSL